MHSTDPVPVPVKRLPHGEGLDLPAYATDGANARKVTKKHAFEGVIPNLARRWRDTDSSAVREELGRLPQGTAATAAAAVDAADKAFRAWRSVPAPKRGELVRLFGEEVFA